MVIWLALEASAADWWVSEPSELGALSTALALLWPEEESQVRLGTPSPGSAGYAWDGAALISLADGRRQGCSDAAQAVLIARSWSRVVSEPGGIWLPSLPPTPAPAPTSPARSRTGPTFDLGLGVRALSTEPGAVDGQVAEIGVGWPALRGSASVYLPLAEPGSSFRSARQIRQQLGCSDDCYWPTGAHAIVPVDQISLSASLDAGPTVRLPHLSLSPRVMGGVWASETEVWYFGPLELPGDLGVVESGVWGGAQYGAALDLGHGRFVLRTSAAWRAVSYGWQGQENDLGASPWLGVSGRVQL